MGAAATGGLVAAGAAVVPRARDAVTTAALRRIAASLPASPSARDIGVEYLHRFPDYAAGARFDALVAGAADRFSLFGRPDDLRRRVADAIRRDFERGDVVMLGGWVLSEAAVRLCALWVAAGQDRAGVHGVFASSELPGGESFSWLTPRATFRLAPADGSVVVRVRSGAPFRQNVAISIDGGAPRELTVSGPEWHTSRVDVAAGAANISTLRIVTAEPWSPTNDFRTIGVGLTRAPWNEWS